MRTLQEKYNGIQEGKFSKDHFLAEARMQQPQLITRFNGYDDAVQILKNRGMIQEARVEEARLTNKSLTDYRYKPNNDMDKYPYEQILRGIRVELEGLGVQGTPTAEEYAKALAKVSKNLAKDSIFYTNQLAGVNPKVDLHDKMVDATAKNTVDTFNGMKKAALKEDHSKNPNDKYTVKTCDMEGTPWAVWEGKKRVKGFATKAEAKEYADKQNKKQGLSESVLKEGIKNLIKKVLSEEVIDVEDYNDEDEYDMYGDDEADDIPHPRGYEDQDEIDYDDENFSDPFIDGDLEENKLNKRIPDDTYIGDDTWYDEDGEKELRAEWEKHQATSHLEDKMSYMEWRSEQGLDEAIDTQADKNMVTKLMLMYETDPAKFARLHKQAQTQASTTKDIKFKHLLSLLNRAKAGSVQPKEIPGFEGTRDALDNLFESKSLKDLI